MDFFYKKTKAKDPLDMAEELGQIETDLHAIMAECKDTPIERE